MPNRIPRRDALKQLTFAGAAVAFSGGIIRGQSSPILINGKPVEIAVAAVSPSTVRITVLPIDGAVVPGDGALVAAAAGKPAGRRRERFTPVRAGDLRVRFSADPPTIHVDKGEIDRPVNLETMPLHVRAGAILPLGPVKQHVEQQVDAPLTLVVFPGADDTSSIYEDDGRSFDYRTGEWMRIQMAWRDRNRQLTLHLAQGSRMLPPSPRQIEIRLAGSPDVTRVTFAGKPLEVRL